MTPYESLEQLAASCGVPIDLCILRDDDSDDGLFIQMRDGASLILINRHRTLAQRTAALAEELGHYFKSVGDLRDLRDILAAKSENLGKAWSYQQLLPQPELETQLQNGNGTTWELAEATGLPEDFIQEAVAYHSRRPRLVSAKTLPPEIQDILRKRMEKSVSKSIAANTVSNDIKTTDPQPAPPPPTIHLTLDEIKPLAYRRFFEKTGRYPTKAQKRELSVAFRTEMFFFHRDGKGRPYIQLLRNDKDTSALIRHLFQECFDPHRHQNINTRKAVQ